MDVLTEASQLQLSKKRKSNSVSAKKFLYNIEKYYNKIITLLSKFRKIRKYLEIASTTYMREEAVNSLLDKTVALNRKAIQYTANLLRTNLARIKI